MNQALKIENERNKAIEYKKNLCDFAISLTEFIKESLIQTLLSHTPGEVNVPVLSKIYYARTDKSSQEIHPNNFCFYLEMEPLKIDGHDLITDADFLSSEVKLDAYMSAKSKILTKYTKYKYMHADPKPDNCMFTGEKLRSEAKFIDFGFSSISVPADDRHSSPGRDDEPVNIRCRPGAVRDEWIKRERRARNKEQVYNKYNDVWQEMTILYHTYSDQILNYTVAALKILLTYVQFAHLDHAFTEVGGGTRYVRTLDCVQKHYVILDMIGEEDKKHFTHQSKLDDLIVDCELGIMCSADTPEEGYETLEEMKEEGSWDKTYGFAASYQIMDPLFDPNYYWEVLQFFMDRIKELEIEQNEFFDIDNIGELMELSWRKEITSVINYIDRLPQIETVKGIVDKKQLLQHYRTLRGTFHKSKKPQPIEDGINSQNAFVSLKESVDPYLPENVKKIMGGKFKKLKLKTLKRKNKNMKKKSIRRLH